MQQVNTKISIGIPTYEANLSLVSTVNSILNQTCYKNISQILIVVDGNKISRSVKNKLTDKKIKVVYSKKREGQSARINDIFNLLDTAQIILTNDDIIMDKDALKIIIKKYKKFDLVAGNVKPMDKLNFLERILEVGQQIQSAIARDWNKGDNYLSCNGRFLVLSKNFYKKISVPEKIWNNDAYVYILSQKLGLKFTFAEDIKINYKSPSNIHEHISQSIKFQKSKEDLQRFFKENIDLYYKIPLSVKAKALIFTIIKSPILTLSYLAIFSATRLKNYLMDSSLWTNGYWQTDLSTKVLIK
ncbi:MAG: glycosyl transferase family protein [uncultured bacterium]|uniref:Glycosyltransferase 2-like domain-containing protein n=2 Tax=Candidatus Daviesiibacteriota TaxID=1752718 RepID=A0A1F5K545_9BACT|nr:MAG: glycosyl transferase family protein [uncultured bacterium]KKQ16380.1 MAG: family 2 glycosyl transferase [Candidatus Daviesbacteria bacterium GW2011_GWA1_36_8]OGE36092.1 MAG: hypothetical protein A3E66_02525 [Candidatus Daviesbacteria bacterium RIFCSPHIGHO2_12_FULL_37_16]